MQEYKKQEFFWFSVIGESVFIWLISPILYWIAYWTIRISLFLEYLSPAHSLIERLFFWFVVWLVLGGNFFLIVITHWNINYSHLQKNLTQVFLCNQFNLYCYYGGVFFANQVNQYYFDPNTITCLWLGFEMILTIILTRLFLK